MPEIKLTREMVYDRLRQVLDPELNVDIVSLGLIYQVEVFPNTPRIKITMTLTSPGCPLAGTFEQLLQTALTGLAGIKLPQDLEINLTFDPPWTQDMMTEEVRVELFG